MDKQLLVVGWDAATSSHLDEFDLEFFDSLSDCDTLLPEPFWQSREIDSGTAWTTITTGLSMWDHRVGSLSGLVESPRFEYVTKLDRYVPRNVLNTPARIWFRRLGLGNQPTNDDIPYKRVWHYVPDSMAVAVPLTYPPKPTDGVTVSGFPSPEVGVQPPELESPVKKRYSPEPTKKFDDEGNIRDEYVDELFDSHLERRELVCWLDEQRDFSFHFVTFTLLDRLLHLVNEADGRIKEAYELMDETTQLLVDELDPDDILVVSDHGMKYAPRWKWQHIHDEKTGIWAGTDEFDIDTHLDVTPAVLEYYDREMENPDYDQDAFSSDDRSSVSGDDTEAMEERLRDLGYL